MLLLGLLIVVLFIVVTVWGVKTKKGKIYFVIITCIFLIVFIASLNNISKLVLQGKLVPALGSFASLVAPPKDLFLPVLNQSLSIADTIHKTWEMKHRYLGTYALEFKGDWLDRIEQDKSFVVSYSLRSDDRVVASGQMITEPSMIVLKPEKSLIYATYRIDDSDLINKAMSLELDVEIEAELLDKEAINFNVYRLGDK